MAAPWSIPPGSRSTFPAGTPFSVVKQARDEAHKRARDRLRAVEALAAELADFPWSEECEEPEPDE